MLIDHPFLRLAKPWLYPLAWFYALVISLRNRLYDLGWFRTRRLPVPVISVGNISAGGTGKTPLTLALAKILGNPPYGRQAAILSRGYRRKSKGYQLVSRGQGPICPWEISGDEPQLFANKLAGVFVAVDENRARGGRALIQSFSPQVIVLDDGFQHRRLDRDMDIVLLDLRRDLTAKMLPLGMLREPLSSLKRAHLIILTNHQHDNASCDDTWRHCEDLFGANRLLACRSMPSSCTELRTGAIIALEDLAGKRLIPFCGIAKPEGFLETLEKMGAEVPFLIRFPDHHCYKLRDVERLAAAYAQQRASYLVTTEKDAVKLGGLFSALPILVLQIEIEWLRGFENLSRELNRVLAKSSEKSP